MWSLVSTVKVREAGVASVLPAGSVARTANECEPLLRLLIVCGEVQDAYAPESTLHSKVEPPSVAEKVNWALAVVIVSSCWGPLSIVVSGAAVSTLKVRVAVAALPAASVARTVKV